MMLNQELKYKSYKDSGQVWLGPIPSEWELKKSKYVWREIEDRSDNGEEQLLSVSQYDGVVPAISESRSESLEAYKKVYPDHLVTNIMLAWMGGLGVSEHDGIVSPAYAVYRLTEDHNANYLGYLYRTKVYLAEFARRSKGVVPSRWRMYTDDFGQVLTLLPPKETQKRIVDFLDAKTAEIDAAIAKKRRLIDLLNEQKAILINRAVTRGLNPDVPMKDSGIDWIGEIPAHWEVAKVKGVFDLLDNHRIPLSGDVRGRMTERAYDYYGASGIIDKVDDYIFDQTTILVAEDGANLVMRNLPLAIIATGKYWVNNHAHILSPRDGDVHYWANALQAADYRPLISGAAQPKLTKDAIKNVSIPCPPSEEQSVISQWLEEIPKNFLPVEEAIQREISTLNEFKQTLIANAVTGKIKI